MIKLNKVIQGDCLDVMKEIDDKSIDMILCDLPYGTLAAKWDIVIPFELLWYQYERIIKDKGAVVLTANQPFASQLITSNLKMFKYEWTWVKSRTAGFLNASDRPLTKHEHVLVFSKGGAARRCKSRMNYNPQGLIEINKVVSGVQGKNSINDHSGYDWGRPSRQDKIIQKYTNFPNSVLFIPNDGKTVHPTQKPVALFEYLIKTYTNEGDLVLDNCAGSGTTGVACKNTNRNFILIEKEEKYCRIAEERLSGEMIKGSKKPTKESSKGFFK